MSRRMRMETPVDIVYTWCDSADPVWNAKRRATAMAYGLESGVEANAECRFFSNDELKYSLRSVERCVPWVRKVFLVIDDDITPPVWLRLGHPKLRIVRLSEIMPSMFLPCFCSETIEHHISRIHDLSERFLYANDDMMFYRPLDPGFFFAADGYPYFRFGGKKRPLPDGQKSHYLHNIDNAAALIRDTYDELFHDDLALALARYPHHCVDAYCKSDMQACDALYARVLKPTFAFPFRASDQIERAIYSYDAIARGHGHFRQARFRIGDGRPWYKRLLRPGRADSLQFYGNQWQTGPAMLEKWKPGLFCFNDTETVSDENRKWLKKVYERLFPLCSTFERDAL